MPRRTGAASADHADFTLVLNEIAGCNPCFFDDAFAHFWEILPLSCCPGLAQKVRYPYGKFRFEDPPLSSRKPETERRQWTRLPLPIPVFVRSRDENGKELLEFANALNVSAGGALIALRRSLPLSSRVSLEIPSAPLGASATLTKSSRNLPARALRVNYAEGYHLIGLKFSRPLLNGRTSGYVVQRKTASVK
jgi:hypothetical protein